MTAPDPALVTIASASLTARINPLGAELWSLCDAAGRDYLTDADPAFWTGHAPLLFPIVGALTGGTYRLGDRHFALPKHGFARTSQFDLIAHAADRAVFRLLDSEQTLAAWPFRFILDVTYLLDGDRLTMTATLTNRDDEALWFSFGFHPAFAWPLPGGAAKDDHRVSFAAPEPQPIRRIDPLSGLLLPESQATPVVDGVLAPDASQFAADALIWDRLASRALTFGAAGGSSLAIAFPDTPMLGIWQKPGAAYLCIEPWQGIADPQGWDGDFRMKPGVLELAGRATRSFRMDVSVTAG